MINTINSFSFFHCSVLPNLTLSRDQKIAIIVLTIFIGMLCYCYWAYKKNEWQSFYKDQGVISVDWAKNRIGDGKRAFDNGNTYEGEFERGQPSGKGIFSYANGDQYSGEIYDSKPYGIGTMTYSDGTKYEGSFVEGLYLSGKKTYPNGAICEGNFVDNKLHGEGQVTWPTGLVGKGKFSKGWGTHIYYHGPQTKTSLDALQRFFQPLP